MVLYNELEVIVLFFLKPLYVTGNVCVWYLRGDGWSDPCHEGSNSVYSFRPAKYVLVLFVITSTTHYMYSLILIHT